MPHVTHPFLPLPERTPVRLAVSRHCTPLPTRIGPRFVDDLLYRSEDGDHIQQILNFFDTVARDWGLDLNLSKTEMHGIGTAPPRTFTSPSGTPLSTTNQTRGQPHNCYKYLGVYIFTNNQRHKHWHWISRRYAHFSQPSNPSGSPFGITFS